MARSAPAHGSGHTRHGRWTAAVAIACAALGGCATAPAPTPPAPAPEQASLEALMQRGNAAQRDGQHEKARLAWRAAAKAYPTQKQPWSRLAEDFFDAADYGNAILAAQEVLQRDGQDAHAHSVLAVSGLRISTVSLLAMRERSSFPVGSREEAVGLTRAMREALGESTLVPVRSEAVEPPPAAATARKPRQTAQAPAPGAAPTAAARATTPVSTSSALTPGKAAANPFKLLN